MPLEPETPMRPKRLMRLVITHVPTGTVWRDCRREYTHEKYSALLEDLKGIQDMDYYTVHCTDAGDNSTTLLPAKIIRDCSFEIKIGVVR